jgi:hypothetical protein
MPESCGSYHRFLQRNRMKERLPGQGEAVKIVAARGNRRIAAIKKGAVSRAF